MIHGVRHALGSVCVIDHQPRGLLAQHRRPLERLASRAVHLLELRRSKRRITTCLERLAAPEPIFGHCHPARSCDERWQHIAHILRDLKGARFARGVCPACIPWHDPPGFTKPQR